MVKALLVIATVVDLALAALLIGVSGFLFGSGPESMHGGAWLVVAHTAAVVACVAAPFAGFVFNTRGNTGAAMAVAWLPPARALVALMTPAPY